MDRDTRVYYVDTGMIKKYFLDELSLKNFVAECAETLKMEESSSIFIKKTRIGIQRGDTVQVIGEGGRFKVKDIFSAQDGWLIVINEYGEVEDLAKVSLVRE